MWEAYYESLMLEDAVMIGELHRSMADGELEIYEFPHLESDMWDNHPSSDPL